MRYLEAGQGQPLLLLHSFPLNADQWIPQLADVPNGWRFIAPDVSGFGPQAPSTDEPRSMASYADDVLELMTQLGISRVGVAGVSMGGYVALALVRKAAARVSALVLADTRATADTEQGRAARDHMIAMVERDGMAGLTRDMLPKLLGPTSHRERREVVATVTRLIAMNQVAGVRAALVALKERPDSTVLLPTIACPTLILCGEEDTITPLPDSEAMHRAISNSRLVRLPKAGHLSNLETPAAFTAALTEFLS